MVKSLQKRHWLVHVLRRAGVDEADELALDPGMASAEAWAAACHATGLTQDRLAEHVADYFRLKVAALDQAQAPATKLVPEKVSRQYGIFPLRETDRHLTVATADPTDFAAEQALGFISGRKTVFEVAPPPFIADAIDARYSPDQAIQSLLTRVDEEIADSATLIRDSAGQDLDAVEAGAEPVVRLTNLILRDAVMNGATDIHIEPAAGAGTVRFRIDGVLRNYMQLPPAAMVRVVSRVKVMGDLDLADHRGPQAGRTRVTVEGRPYDVRISTLPARDAETVVLRLQAAGQAARLSEIGLPAWELGRLRQLLAHGGGLVFVTGPAGAGKTTTLYAALRERATGDADVMTVEDPVEYELPAVTQIQVEPERGVTFASGLRAVLRQDPDVILVGEIRDLETAELAVEAASTGHLVLATLHTNDAVSVVPRLLDMGLDAASVASTLRGALGQRLVRRLCEECGEPIRGEMTEEEIRLAKLYDLRPTVRSVGCRRCAETGFRGRVPVQEVFVVNAGIADRIAAGAPYSELYEAAVSSGMRPIQQVGLERVRNGETTLEELERVLGLEAEDRRGEPPSGGPVEGPSAGPDAAALIAAAAGDVTPPPAPLPEGTPDASSPAEGVTLGRVHSEAPILIVDDDPEDRLLVRMLLQKQGFAVEEARDGAEALEQIGAGEAHSLVVLDLEMPRVDGREVLARLRKSEATEALPVVVLTGSPDPEDEYRLMEGGADDYLRKPLDPPRFVARVRAALRRARLA